MWPAIAHGHAKALGRANGDICAHLAGAFEQRQRQRIGRHNGQGFVLMQGCNLRCEVAHMAIGAGILEDGAKDGAGVQVIWAPHDNLDPQRLRPGLNHSDILRMAVFIHKEGL